MTELLARQPSYPGLIDSLAAAFSRKITRSIALGDYFGGRQLLRQMTQVAGGHPETAASREKFVALARERIDRSSQADPSTKVDLLAEAARIWPESEGLDQVYARAFQADPTVRVAVVDLADPVSPFPISPAADRVARLIYLPILAHDDEASLRGEVPGQLLASWKVTELGATWQVGLKSGFRWSDGSRPVAAVDLARSLADRASASSPGFNARWADLLDRVTILDDDRLEVKLTRATAKPETWLLEPVGPAHAATDGWVASVGGGQSPVGDGSFRWRTASPDATTFEASPTAPAESNPRLKRLVEVRAASNLTLPERFDRGEIDLIDHVPPLFRVELARRAEIRLGTFRTPSVHRIALDGRTPALSNRKFRRALTLALNRSLILQDQVLGHPPDERNLVINGPFVRGSFVADPDVPAIDYEPVLAKGLVAAAIKELGDKPVELTLEYPALPEARSAVPKLVEAWRAVGIKVQAIERPESSLETGLRAGRRFDLVYRASRPTDPLRDAGPLLVPGFDAPSAAGAFASAASPRILQLLIGLDRAPEPQSARALAIQIDRESRDELPVIPLWQLEDQYAWRTNLRGVPDSTDHLYQGASTWEADPWLAKDP